MVNFNLFFFSDNRHRIIVIKFCQSRTKENTKTKYNDSTQKEITLSITPNLKKTSLFPPYVSLNKMTFLFTRVEALFGEVDICGQLTEKWQFPRITPSSRPFKTCMLHCVPKSPITYFLWYRQSSVSNFVFLIIQFSLAWNKFFEISQKYIELSNGFR